MRILVTGISGQLGYDVLREGKKCDHEMLGSDIVGEVPFLLDITDKEAVYRTVTELKPEVIVHCAAYTAVDKAEEMKTLCWKVNVTGTENLVLAAKQVGAKFVYISTDYVFDGEGTAPFSEEAVPNPKGYYGLTKYEGEKIVQKVLNEHFIIRSSWIFGTNGANFVRTMLSLAETKTTINVVDDQIGSPTYTYDLSQLIIEMIETERYGIYHATNDGFCSWAQFAEEIFKIANKDVKVMHIPTDEYPTKAVRPKNSRMSKQKLIDQHFRPLRSWQEALTHYINELTYEVK